MRIESIDLFYLAVPDIQPVADGTQDTVLVRVRDEHGLAGWGECDASPLVTIASYVCPPSHSNIVNLRDILLGERLDDVGDILRLGDKVRRQALDLGHVHHALSGADIALWDLLGKRLRQPVWRLLERLDSGAEEPPACSPRPKLPYASVLFGDTPEETGRLARALRDEGYRAAKFGWGPLGSQDEAFDVALVAAARAGLGEESRLMVDAGVVWGEDDETAYRRALAFEPFDLTWLEEPLSPDAVTAYGRLCARCPPVRIAAGEGADRFRAVEDLVATGGVHFVQIDAGRIGGITQAHRVRRLAEQLGRVYVNHTFKSHLSLAAALHVFATAEPFELLEYPARGSELARTLVKNRLERGGNGLVEVPRGPGLGVEVDEDVIRRFGRAVRIEVDGRTLFPPSLR